MTINVPFDILITKEESDISKLKNDESGQLSQGIVPYTYQNNMKIDLTPFIEVNFRNPMVILLIINTGNNHRVCLLRHSY